MIRVGRFFCTICHAADPLDFVVGINRLGDRVIGFMIWLPRKRYVSIGRLTR